MRIILFALACLSVTSGDPSVATQEVLGAMLVDPRMHVERTECRCQTNSAGRYNPKHALASILLLPRHSGMLQKRTRLKLERYTGPQGMLSLAPRAACRHSCVEMKKNKKRKTSSSASTPSLSSAPEADAPQDLSVPEIRPSASVDARVDSVLRNAGINPSDDSTISRKENTLDENDPLALIPKKGQELLERVCINGGKISLTVLLTSGLSVSAQSICKILEQPIPVEIDEFIDQFVFPALTPSLLVLFGFTSTLGILKQLQIMSQGENSNMIYTEDD